MEYSILGRCKFIRLKIMSLFYIYIGLVFIKNSDIVSIYKDIDENFIELEKDLPMEIRLNVSSDIIKLD